MSATPKEQPSGKLWGGRFDRAPDELFYQFQRSFSFDRRLLPYELAVDRVWAGALESAGILSVEEMRDTLTALDKIGERAANEFAWLGGSPAEDVHHSARSDTSCTPAAAATNSWLQTSACLSWSPRAKCAWPWRA